MHQSYDFYSVRNFRLILKHEFESRKQRRAAYSLNAFARDLGFSSARLTGVFKGRHGISAEAAQNVAEKLSFSKNQKAFFSDLVQSQHGRSAVERKEAALRLLRFKHTQSDKVLDPAATEIMSRWYILATLELIKIHAGEITEAQVAKKLRLKKSEACAAIKCLLRCNQIRSVESGFEFNKGFLTGTSAIPSEVIRNFHGQFLDQTKSAIKRVPFKERKNRSSFICFDRSRIEEARLRLEKFHNEFVEEFATDHGADGVYGFGLYLFPLDEK